MSYNQANVTVHTAFRFVVAIEGVAQAAFTECQLPDIDLEVQEVKEGGLNTYTHQLPGRRKLAKVVLKNGIGNSDLLEWYQQVMGEEFQRRQVTITLMDVAHERVLDWHISEAYPIKWSGPQLKTDSTSVAVETLELACGEVTLATD